MKNAILVLLLATSISFGSWIQVPVKIGTNGVSTLVLDNRFYAPVTLDSIWYMLSPVPTNDVTGAIFYKEASWTIQQWTVSEFTNKTDVSVSLIKDLNLIVKQGDTLTITNSAEEAKCLINFKRE